MSVNILEIGKVYSRDELVVSLELNLQDLYFVQALVPSTDGFRKDLQEGIEAIEKRNELRSNVEGQGLSLVMVEGKSNRGDEE